MSLNAPALSATVKSPLDLIGRTPMVEVTKIDTGKCRLLLKLESQNPGGSRTGSRSRCWMRPNVRDG